MQEDSLHRQAILQKTHVVAGAAGVRMDSAVVNILGFFNLITDRFSEISLQRAITVRLANWIGSNLEQAHY